MQRKVPEVQGIQQADFQNWKHHPVTRVFHQYLKDYHDMLKDRAWDVVFSDPKADLGELVGRAKTLIEMVDLPFEAMFMFYQPEETDATEITQ